MIGNYLLGSRIITESKDSELAETIINIAHGLRGFKNRVLIKDMGLWSVRFETAAMDYIVLHISRLLCPCDTSSSFLITWRVPSYMYVGIFHKKSKV